MPPECGKLSMIGYPDAWMLFNKGGKLATQLIMMNPLENFISKPSTVEGVLLITTPHYLIDHDV